MNQRPISVSSVVFDGYPIETAIREIAKLGLPLIEPAYIKGYMDFDETAFSDDAAKNLSGEMKQRGLGAIAISAHMDTGHHEAIAMLQRRIRFTAAIGARFTITNSTNAENRASLEKTIAASLPLAEQLGVIIALENPGHGQTNLMRDGASGALLVQSFNSPWLRFNYDTGNTLTCSENATRPEVDVENALPLCCHMHLKDVVRTDGQWRYTAIGQGEIDYETLLPKLRNYPDIPLTLELPLRLKRKFHHDPGRDEQLVPIATICAAIQNSWSNVSKWL